MQPVMVTSCVYRFSGTAMLTSVSQIYKRFLKVFFFFKSEFLLVIHVYILKFDIAFKWMKYKKKRVRARKKCNPFLLLKKDVTKSLVREKGKFGIKMQ